MSENPLTPENTDVPAASVTPVKATAPKVKKASVGKATAQDAPTPEAPSASAAPAVPSAPVAPEASTSPAASTRPVPNYYFPPAAQGVASPPRPPVAGGTASSNYAGSLPPAGTTPPSGTIPPAFGGNSASRAPKRGLSLPIVAALAIGAVIGGASGAGMVIYFGSQNGSTNASVTAQGITINDAANVSSVTAVAAKASPSVVTISVVGTDAAGSGSGIVLSADGYVLTNNHVATLDGATGSPEIQVRDNSGRLYSATIVGTDPTVDLAVIKLEGATDLTPIEWADSAKLNVGDEAIAMGAPLGLAGTVTTGIVSALNRSIQIASSAVPDAATTPDQGTTPDGSGPFDFWNFDFGQGEDGSTPTPKDSSAATTSISIPVIQTDAAINPGNSGGALLDSKGRLIGINVAIASAGSASGQSGSIGVGFALPSNLAKRVSEEIIATGTATHGLLGAQVSDAANKTGSTNVGALIEEVVSGGAAEKAGIAKGDVVTRFNGVPITDANDITAQVRTMAAGSQAEVEIVRDGKTQTIKVTLGSL